VIEKLSSVLILQNYHFFTGFQCQYAVIRFHRCGVLAPDYAILSTQEALLARIKKRVEQGYSFAFWLKNLQTYGLHFSAKGRTALLCLRTLPCQRASKTSIVDRRIKKCRTMKTNNNISNRRGRASISSLNRIKRVLLWAVGIIGAILGLVLWVIYIKFEPSGTPNGSFAFIDTDGCQRVVNSALLKIVK